MVAGYIVLALFTGGVVLTSVVFVVSTWFVTTRSDAEAARERTERRAELDRVSRRRRIAALEREMGIGRDA